MMPASSAFGSSGLKLVAVILAFGLALFILGPPLHWRHADGAVASRQSASCSPCICECASESESVLLPGFGNTPSDCEKLEPVLNEDADKNSVELLKEELKLQEAVSEESQLHADSALLDAKRLASQFQKEAEKCSSGMETCEEAREKSQAAFEAQKKISVIWEKRAREMGWRDKPDQQSIFSRIGLSEMRNDGQSVSFFRRRKHKL